MASSQPVSSYVKAPDPSVSPVVEKPFLGLSRRATQIVAAGFAFGLGIALVALPVQGLDWANALIAAGAVVIAVGSARRAGIAEARSIFLRHAETDAASYRAFVDNAVEGIFRTSRDGQYLFANTSLAKIYGYETPHQLVSELTDISRELYVDNERRFQFHEIMRSEERVHNFDSRIRRRDGSIIWISENARAVRDSDGMFLYYEGTVEDITSAVEAEETTRRALQEAQDAARSKAAFLAAMSHELKTPLNAVIGFSELMIREIFGPVEEPRYKSYLVDIHENGRRLLTMINDILDLTRIEGKLIALDESSVAMDEAADEVWSQMVETSTQIPFLVREIAPNLPMLRGDAKRLRQVLTHILSNAVKFTPPTGHIRVSGQVTPEGGIRIAIADSGIGMDPARISSALEPFKQLDGRLSRRFEGVGLGLPLALALTRLHDGTLHVDSEPGKGTTVTLDFPPERVVIVPQALRA